MELDIRDDPALYPPPDRELQGRAAILAFEPADEMGGIREVQVVGDLLDVGSSQQKFGGVFQAQIVQPLLGGLAKFLVEIALKLAGTDPAKPCQIGGVVTGLAGQRRPVVNSVQMTVHPGHRPAVCDDVDLC